MAESGFETDIPVFITTAFPLQLRPDPRDYDTANDPARSPDRLRCCCWPRRIRLWRDTLGLGAADPGTADPDPEGGLVWMPS